MAENVLVTRALTKRYGGTLAVDHADITLAKGEIYGLVGRNGAGKTTIIRMAAAQTVPTEGEVELFGAIGEKELEKARARTGAMVEIPSFYPYLTARENLEYYRRQRGIAGAHAVEDALEQVGLADTGKKKFKAFSLGMKQRLGLALALMNRPDLLLLDEPINGLDPEGIVEFRNLLLELNRQYQTTILISSHILSELSRLATHYGFIDRGQMIKEISARELEAACRKCVRVKVSDIRILCRVLDDMDIQYSVLENSQADIFAQVSVSRLDSALAEKGCELLSMQERDESLESYYVNLIGGGHDE